MHRSKKLANMPPSSSVQMLALALLSLSVPASAIARPSNVREDCKIVEAHLPGTISFPKDSIYTSSLGTYYSEEEREIQPICVFSPTSTAQVSQFIKLITARGSKSEFAVRSGGHTYIGGAANVAGGITVDMRGIHDVTFSQNLDVVSIGGGAVWSSDVYPSLVEHNLIAAGARLPGIGIGGFVTGGGQTFLARRNGWACDTVLGYEVVLASGEVVIATADTHSDLWLALKGGSNNFGIVTHFHLSTYPQKNMLGGIVAFNYTQSTLDAHAAAFSNFMAAENFDEKAMMGLLITYENGVSAVTDSLFYLDPVASPAVYESFISMPGQVANKLVVTDAGTVVNNFGSFTPPSLNRVAEINYSFKNGGPDVYTRLFQIYNESLTELAKHSIPGGGIQWLLQPRAVSAGVNSLGLSPNVTDIVLVDLIVGWDDVADDDYMMAFIQNLANKQVQWLVQKGVHDSFIYLNYAGQQQDPIGSYGTNGRIKDHLQSVSKKYDPSGIFQHRVPGGFKLFT
ncbi:FAD-binding domain-containing protein [Xylaria sp. FL0043]|nr:FAD-binding domain-containing protein [Xylaria sp. FL0043]